MTALPYVVIDASVAGAWLFAEAASPAARPLLGAIVGRRVVAIVPDRFDEEMLRLCQKKAATPPQGAGVAVADAFERFLDLMTLPVPLYRLPSSDLHERAWQMTTSAGGLTTHDALYLALAERWEATLWTNDTKLSSPAARALADVKNIRVDPIAY